ncbi:hypothetical protein [Bacillus phage vB_BanS-Thrax5]|nr:hypothetical protein [Bacillus phage vB_BanS-Thrax5]
MLTLNEKEMEIVSSEFGFTVQEVEKMIDNGDIELYTSYSMFFYKIHEDKSKDDLIEMMENNETAIDELNYHVLPSGKVAYTF